MEGSPGEALLLFDFRLLFAYPMSMGEMRRAIVRENDEAMRDRFSSTLVIAAAIIAAVRLAREDIKLSPRVVSAVSDSVARVPADFVLTVGRTCL